MRRKWRTRVAFLASTLLMFGVSPNVARAQSWTGVLQGLTGVPANDSPATGNVTVTVSGSRMLVQLTWNDLRELPTRMVLFPSRPTNPADVRAAAVGVRNFVPDRDGRFTHEIDLDAAGEYDARFLRQHGGSAVRARQALVAALDRGYFAIVTQPRSVIEIGAKLTRADSNQ